MGFKPNKFPEILDLYENFLPFYSFWINLYSWHTNKKKFLFQKFTELDPNLTKKIHE